MTPTVDLLAALCAHLAEFDLPAIASVHVGAELAAPPVTVQLACCEPAPIAQELLAWAETFAQVTAQALRVSRGDSVHLSVTGGASIRVYGGQWATHRDLDHDLPSDATTTVPLPMLRHAATIEEMRH